VTRLAAALAQALQIARRWRPDLIEYQGPQQAGLVAALAALLVRRPLVGGVYNDFLDQPAWLGHSRLRRAANRLGHWVLRRSAAVRCDSPETTAALNRAGYRQVEYIPFFMPWLEQFAASAETQAARLARWTEAPVILCLARLAEEKNIALLLEALAQPRPGIARARLMLAGAGPQAARLQRLAADLGLTKRIVWLGPVAFADLPRLYREANLFVLPSNSETSARVLILAQAARLPTVTTATSGSRSVVRDGRSGYVTPLNDAPALGAALDRLLSDRALYQRMLQSPEYYDAAPHTEAGVMPRLREFYARARRPA
jgi:glycosyltransferase involved in cell wall biosynthesis